MEILLFFTGCRFRLASSLRDYLTDRSPWGQHLENICFSTYRKFFLQVLKLLWWWRAENALEMHCKKKKRLKTHDCGTFSHCNPVFPEKGFMQGAGIVSSTTPLYRPTPRGSGAPSAPAWRSGTPSPSLSLFLQGGPTRLLNGASHVSITWNINQCVRGRSTCLFDFGGHRDSCERSKNNLIYLRGCVTEAGGFVARLAYFSPDLSDRKFNSFAHNAAAAGQGANSLFFLS